MCLCRRSQEKILIVWHAPPASLGGGRGVKNFRKVFAGGGVRNFYFGGGEELMLLGRCGGSLLKRFALFSYLNHSFILSLNVKVCIRFIVFLEISLCQFFICQF